MNNSSQQHIHHRISYIAECGHQWGSIDDVHIPSLYVLVMTLEFVVQWFMGRGSCMDTFKVISNSLNFMFINSDVNYK